MSSESTITGKIFEFLLLLFRLHHQVAVPLPVALTSPPPDPQGSRPIWNPVQFSRDITMYKYRWKLG